MKRPKFATREIRSLHFASPARIASEVLVQTKGFGFSGLRRECSQLPYARSGTRPRRTRVEIGRAVGGHCVRHSPASQTHPVGRFRPQERTPA